MFFSKFVVLSAQAALVLTAPIPDSRVNTVDRHVPGEPHIKPTVVNATFEKAVTVKASTTVLTEIKLPPTKLGNFGIQMMDNYSRQVSVSEQKKPQAKAPTGWKLVDTSSYLVSVTASETKATENVSFGMVMYSWAPATTGQKATNYSAARFGRVDEKDKTTFVVNEKLGVPEFEDNETKFMLPHISGEWAIFMPTGGKGSGNDGGNTGGGNTGNTGNGVTTNGVTTENTSTSTTSTTSTSGNGGKNSENNGKGKGDGKGDGKGKGDAYNSNTATTNTATTKSGTGGGAGNGGNGGP